MKILFLGYDAWGDWISYNGLIRYLAERFDTVYIKLDYGGAREPFVNDLFKDDENIHIFHGQSFDLTVDAHTYHEPSTFGYNRQNKLGDLYSDYTLDPFKDPLPSNPACFYQYLGLSDSIRTDYFHFERNRDQEDALFDKLGLGECEYDVVCEPSHMPIQDKYHSERKLINIHNISPRFTDTLRVVEEANEVHLVDTSPASFVYHLQYKDLIKRREINFHAYARKGERSCDGVNESNVFTEHNKYWNNNLRCINAMLTPKLDNWNFIWE